MAKPKHKYNVYVRQIQTFDPDFDLTPYPQQRYEYRLGSTWAVSEKQAINNVRAREYGATHANEWGDMRDMLYLVAFRVDEDSPAIHDKFLRGE